MVKLITLNIKGIGNEVKRNRMYKLIRDLKPDILFLQEIHNPKVNSGVFASKQWKQKLLAPDSNKARGVAILIKEELDFQIKKVLKDKKGRYILVEGLLQNQELITLA